MSTREPYKGSRRKLLLAFDIGTTYSGVSYCLLDPGLVPDTKSVTRFPCQTRSGGDAKIPTVIYYDKNGDVKAIGAETLEFEEGLVEDDEKETFFKAEWFKLHLRPNSTLTGKGDESIPPLPLKKTIVHLLSDFMKYMFTCARTFITESAPNAQAFWESFADDIEFVLTHPNGWGGPQQALMRQAAIMAGLIDADAPERVQFCTEGEASLHFCLQNGLSLDALGAHDAALILDCGGGTVDISTYAPLDASGPKTAVHEIAAPQCLFNGSIFVTRRAREHIYDKIKKSKFKSDIDHIMTAFDRTTKLTFKSAADPQFIRFGGIRDTNASLGIKSGQMKLSGCVVADFFDPALKAIIQVVKNQQLVCAESERTIKAVFLVGGFAASDYLFAKLKNHFEELDIQFCRPDTHVNKAVADGAISFIVDHVVRERVSRMAYGIRCNNLFDATKPGHMQRRSTVYVSDAGDTRIPGCFDMLLPKDVRVKENKEFKRSYSLTSLKRDAFRKHAEPILSYRGNKTSPEWIDDEPNHYATICTVNADFTRIVQALPALTRPDGSLYFKLHYDVILLFGTTEMKAQIAWKENGVEQRSRAEIIYS